MKTVFIPTRFKDPLPPGAPEHGALVEQSDGGSTEMRPARRWPDGRIEIADVRQTLSGFLDATAPPDEDDSDDDSDLEVAAMTLVCEARKVAQVLDKHAVVLAASSVASLACELREAADSVSRALDADEEET